MRKMDEREQRGRAGRGWHARAFAVTWIAFGLGCGDGTGLPGEVGEAQRGSSKVGGAVVSTVDGHPIHVADVEEVARASSLSPHEALERLQAELLLMSEAERRGVSGAEIEAVAVRARVQALLEAEAAASAAPESDVREAYEKDARFHKPERRVSVHVLARVASTAKPQEVEAARAIAAAAIPEVGRSSIDELRRRYASTIGSVGVKAEALPAFDRKAPLAPEYSAAMFSLSAPGVVPEPVRTSFGWHAIRVTEIIPAEETPYEKAAPVLREELSVPRQRAAIQELLKDLRRAHPVQVMKDVDDKLTVVDGAEANLGR
jgi:hypothetical protein